MGLKKIVELPNGLPLGYHRVSMIYLLVNGHNAIEVSSYISSSKRQEEVEHQARLMAGEVIDPCDVLIEARIFQAPYDPSMTVESAYEYLLTLPEFEGAEMEDTEYMLDAIETVPDIEAELAQPEPESEPAEEGGE